MWFLEYIGQIIIAILISLLICFVYIFIKNSKKNNLAEKSRRFVQWVTADEHNQSVRLYPLHVYLNNARTECNLSDNYAIITENEKNYEAVILDEFKRFLTKQHLNNNLSLIKSRHTVPKEVQFFYLLSNFLYNHETDITFASQEIRSEKISEKYYESGGKDIVFALSEFGIVYYKLQFIAINGYLKSDIVKSNDFLLKIHKDYLKDVLSTNTIELSYS